jgi:hypothetical protein
VPPIQDVKFDVDKLCKVLLRVCIKETSIISVVESLVGHIIVLAFGAQFKGIGRSCFDL